MKKPRKIRRVVLGEGYLDTIPETCGHPPAKIGEYLGCNCVLRTGVAFIGKSPEFEGKLEGKKGRLVFELFV